MDLRIGRFRIQALAMKTAVFELGFTLGSWPGSTGGALAMKTAVF